jgi:hypothetical protein
MICQPLSTLPHTNLQGVVKKKKKKEQKQP